MGDMESVRGSTTIQQDHIQTVGRQWEIQGQWVIQQLSSKVTYFLWAGDGRQSQ
jgi:hypothetical protein